jgi:Mn2+/Fe2+ NRAMP family transporter
MSHLPSDRPAEDAAGGAPGAGAPAGTKMSSSTRSTLLGAMFLMATSAIGPGFITQTTAFTVELGVAFAFAIAVSIVVDIALQLNVWRVIGVTGRRAQELGNLVLPGLGYAMAALLVLGGLVFNVGNVSGAGLGTDAMFGLDPRLGGALSALIAVGIFLSKRAGMAIDRIVVLLGVLMIGLTTYIAITSGPPVGQALKNVVLPDRRLHRVRRGTPAPGLRGQRTRARPGHHPGVGHRDRHHRGHAGRAFPGDPRGGHRRR